MYQDQVHNEEQEGEVQVPPSISCACPEHKLNYLVAGAVSQVLELNTVSLKSKSTVGTHRFAEILILFFFSPMDCEMNSHFNVIGERVVYRQMYADVHSGPEGTPFEGGVFVTELIFPTDYPLSPPKMKFLSEMFHPYGNYMYFIYAGGKPLAFVCPYLFIPSLIICRLPHCCCSYEHIIY